MERPGAIADLDHVSLSFEGGEQALRDVTLAVTRGEWLCVLGSNGSGKSTLAQVITGLLAPDSGQVTLVGERVYEDGRADVAAYARARKHLGLVFQNPDDQIVTTVVEEDVAFGPENLGLSPAEIGARVERELARVALSEHAKDNPTRLSGGQKQRVAIAGALALEPEILVLDEPGALLDVRGREAIMRVARRLNQAGTTIVHVTHFMDEALYADRVVVLKEGSIALKGTPVEVFSQVDMINTLGLEMPRPARLAVMLSERGVGVQPLISEDGLIELLSGLLGKTHWRAEGTGDGSEEAVASSAPGNLGPARTGFAQTSIAPEAVGATGIAFSYHDADMKRPALMDVSLSVPRATTCAIVGQTGSGKSTLLRILCGLEMPDAGELRVCGDLVRGRREWRRLRGRVGYVMQHPERQLFAETVEEDVAFGPTNLGLKPDEVRRRVSMSLEAVGLADKAHASPFELSGGQQRLCAIAGVLAMKPEVLVLDEPTAGLDPRGRIELRQIIDVLAVGGTTIVVVTHSMEDAARKDQVVILNDGGVLAVGAPDAVFAPEHAQALKDCGLGLPWPLAFALKLRDRGCDVGLPLTMDVLADSIAVSAGASGAGGDHGA